MVTANEVSIGLSVGTQPPLRRIDTFGRLAQWLGFDVAWTVDHFLGWFPQEMWDKSFSWLADPGRSPHPFFDYQVILGRLATKLRRIQVGVGVTEAIRRHPIQIAQAFSTLAHVAARPPILGIGAGERENIEPYGLSFDRPVGRLEEALRIIRLCFDSRGPIAFEGRHFRFADAVMDLNPPEDRRPQIWVAAHEPRMLRLAGEHGDGWYPALPMPVSGYAERLAAVRAAASASGRDPAAIVPGWSAYAVIAPTASKARDIFDHPSVRFLGLLAPDRMWREFGEEHPLGAGFGGLVDFVPHRYQKAQLVDALAKVPTEAIAERVLWGDPAQMLAKLGDYVDAGLRHVTLQPVSALVSRRDALYGLRHMASILRKLKRRPIAG